MIINIGSFLHIGLMDNTSVSGYRDRWFNSSAAPICCVRKQDTLFALHCCSRIQSINVLFQYSDIQLSINFNKFQNSTMNTEIGKKISKKYL